MSDDAPRTVGRYTLFGEIASGGMATVRFGRALGPHGFARTVAVKCLLPSLARERDFVEMFLDEARLAARISHPNVVSTLDVVAEDDELLVVMEYVPGESLSRLHRELRRRKERVPLPITCAVLVGLLEGLHAAHEAESDQGAPLGLVHRDVSPQNVLVGVDGVARVLDFGIAKAAGRLHKTRDGQIKGKIAYMAPEQMLGEAVDRRTDVYAAGVVLWELLTGRGLFHADSDQEVYAKVLAGAGEPPSAVVPEVPPALDRVVMTALALRPEARFADARAMAEAIEAAAGHLPARRVGEWVQATAAEGLARRAAMVRALESRTAEAARGSAPRLAAPSRASSPGPREEPRVAEAPAAAPALDPPPPEASTVPQVHVALARKAPADGRLVWVGVTAFVAAGGLALGIGLAGSPGPASAPSAPPPESPAQAASSLQSSSPSRTADPPAPAPPPAKSTLVGTTTIVAQTAPPATAPAPSVRPAPPRPNKPNPCEPPWVLDSAGIKRFKPGCL